MSGRAVRALLIAAGAIALMAAPARAQDDVPAAAPHLRGTNADAGLLLDELIVRSPSVRDLIDRLDESDLIVYIRFEWFTTSTLRGRIGILAADDRKRFLAIEISSRQTRTDQLVALAHELRHAVEIAEAPLVSDARSLAALYTSIGRLTGYGAGKETYETDAAQEMGRRVRGELTSAAADLARD